MQLIRYINPQRFVMGCVLSIGNFDGIHLGHQAIASRVMDKSRQLGIPSVIMTFEPHPHEFFTPDSTDRLMGLREKFLALDAFGPDYMLVMRFNQKLAATSAVDFIEQMLIGGLNVKSLIVGDDFRFGKQRQGDFELLSRYAAAGDFELENTHTLEVGKDRVSSTRIRQALRESDFKAAEDLLGQPFFIAGRVTHGEKRGRTLGYPTLNLRLKKNRTLVSGVFAVEVHGLGVVRQGVANMGYRPTIHGKRPLLEVHVFNYDEDCYGRQVRVVFRHKLRDEQRFESIEILRRQIRLDAAQARQLLCP